MTLPRFFALAVGSLAALAALVLALSVRTSSAAVLRVGESARDARAAQVVTSVEADLSAAEEAVQDFERAIAEGIVDDEDPRRLQDYLTAELIARRGLTELTLTSARLLDYEPAGDARLAAAGRRQLSLWRDAAGAIGRRVAADFAPGATGDPTTHDTFRAAAHRDEDSPTLCPWANAPCGTRLSGCCRRLQGGRRCDRGKSFVTGWPSTSTRSFA